MRALFFFLLVLLLFGIIMMISKRIEMARRKAARENRPDTAEKMVPCARCGVHVPASSACGHEGRAYCPDHCPDTEASR